MEDKWAKYKAIYVPEKEETTPIVSDKWSKFKASLVSDFDTAVVHILKKEGGYVNDPDDPGGETNFGISSVYNPDVDVANLSVDDAKQIYKDRYWDAIDADTLPPNIRMQMFDTAVNMGVGTANRLLQESEGDPNKFLELRKQKYRRIADERPSSRKFLDNWLSRSDEAATISGIAPAQEQQARTLLPKQEWKDDPVVEDLKAKDEVSGWTSATNFAKFKVFQDNSETDVVNEKIKGIDEKEKLIREKITTESKAFEQQQKAEFDALNADYKTKSEKINEKYSKALPKAKTKEEYESLKKEHQDALNKEHEAYVAKFEEKQVKYKEQAQKLTEGFTKEQETLGKDVEGLNKELETQGKDTKIKTRIIQDAKKFQSIVDNAPEDYNGKKEFIKKQVADAVDDYIYQGGTDVNAFKEELYAVINEKLLFDKDGTPTVYAIKNQAEIAKRALKQQWDAYNKKLDESRQGTAKHNPFELQDERERLTKATENLDVVLEMPEGTKEDKKGGFFQGWGSQKGWLDRAMGMGVITRGADVQFSKVAKKSQQGVPLNATEQALLDSEAILATATDKLKPGFSAMYQAGAGTGGSIEWMTSMASTSGIYSKVFKGALKGLGYKVGAKILSGNLPKYLAAEAAGALARVPLQAPFYVDVMTRRAGITPEAGKIAGTVKGNAYVPEESFTKSVVTSTYSQFAENLSEMAGKYIDFGVKVGKAKLIEQVAKKFNLGALSRVAKSKASQAFGQTTNRLGIGQPIGEFTEEKIAEVLHWVDGSTQPKDFFDRQQNWVTFLSVATMVAPFNVVRAMGKSPGELKTTDFLNKDQVTELNKITSIADIELKGKKLGEFILKNDLQENFEQQEAVAKQVWDSQQDQVAEEMAKPEATEVKEEGGYSQGNFVSTRENVRNAIENADTIGELETLGIDPNDTELKKLMTERANLIGKLEEEDKLFDKEIEAAGVDEVKLEQAQKEHQKRKALILSGKQIGEPVKSKAEEKLAEKQTQISETQLTPELTEQPKTGTVKPEVQPELSKAGKDLKKQFDQFSKKAKNALPTVIVDSIDQLPKEVKDRMGKVSEDAKVQAFVDPKTNTAYFVAQNIPKDKVVAKWVHEQGIHRGLEVLVPNQKDRTTLLNKVFDSVGVDKIKESLPKVYGAKFDKGSLSKEGIAEEYMAHLAEKIITEKDLTPEEKSVWQKIKDYIEKIIRKTYGKAKLTDKEIAEVIRASVKSIYTEEKTKPKEQAVPIKDYIENNKTQIFSQLKEKGIIKVKGEC